MGRGGIRGLKARVRRECCISRGAKLNRGGNRPEESEGEVTVLQ